MDNKPKEPLNLNRLRARMREKPGTKAGRVGQAWPENKDQFAAAHSLKDIWTWLSEIGIERRYPTAGQAASQAVGLELRQKKGAQRVLRLEKEESDEARVCA